MTGLSRLWSAALAGLLAVLLTLLVWAPASLLDWAVQRNSAGRVALTETTGSVWRGSGRLVFVDVARLPVGGEAATPVLPGVAVPGRLRWTVRVLPLLLGLIDAQVTLEGMGSPVRLSGSPGEVRVSAGSLSLPMVDLGRLGSPWNTIKPSGSLALKWDGLVVRRNGFDGRAEITLRDMSSALSPVRPLGTYRIDLTGDGARAALSISTLEGPLRLSGEGSWDARAGVRFDATAIADPSERQRLDAFLGLVGRRVGGQTIIKIGA